MLIDEVQSFASDFINIKSFRNSIRKAKIREAYRTLTGKEIKVSCSTCYIEALLFIVNSKPMATHNYELKRGVLLEAFGDASKTCTNDTLTDELAVWYLTNQPEKIIYFSKLPDVIPPKEVPPKEVPHIVIIPPVVETPPVDIVRETLYNINTPEPQKKVVKKTKK